MSSGDDNIIHVNFGGEPDSSPGELEASPEDLEAGAEKLRLFASLLDEGTVMVTLDSRRDGVVVPAQFTEQPRLNLNFDHQFRISDFDYDEVGVRASLSFGGVDRWCEVPWTAVYMMRSLESQEVMLFPGQLPAEMAAMIPEIERAIRAHEGESEASDDAHEVADEETDETT
jgi:stringent starvation protein B